MGWKRFLTAVGPRRAIRGLGGLYVVLAVGRALVQIDRGAPFGNVLIVTLLIAVPGFVLSHGGYWISRANIDAEFYPDILGWCLAGFGAMASILVLYHLQPDGSISSPATSPPILTALSSVAGFAVGVHNGRAKTRTRQLEQRNAELERTQAELEETVRRLEETNTRLEESNERLERYRQYTDHVLNTIHDIFYVLEEDGTVQR